MYGEDWNLSKIEYRSVIKDLFLKGLSGKEFYDDKSTTLRDQCPSYSTGLLILNLEEKKLWKTKGFGDLFCVNARKYRCYPS